MIATASASIDRRSSVLGQRSPRMCSLRASPVPTPRRNRPPVRSEDVAAAWAMIAGWMRTVGQVTAVVTSSDVVAAMAPITLQTNGLSPWSSNHGWKWSEIHTDSKPAVSACCAWSSNAPGPCSSLDRKYPNRVIVATYPRWVRG